MDDVSKEFAAAVAAFERLSHQDSIEVLFERGNIPLLGTDSRDFRCLRIAKNGRFHRVIGRPNSSTGAATGEGGFSLTVPTQQEDARGARACRLRYLLLAQIDRSDLLFSITYDSGYSSRKP
jgi:hypothetical protein